MEIITTMIPKGTVELLESITNYLDRRKDAQDGDYGFCVVKPPFPWVLRPLSFPAPTFVDGSVSEEEFYRWLSVIKEVFVQNEEFEEERLTHLIKYDGVLQAALAPRDGPEAEDEEPTPAEESMKGHLSRDDLGQLSTPIVYPDPTLPRSSRWSLSEDEMEDRRD
jgi:hypothetical protein